MVQIMIRNFKKALKSSISKRIFGEETITMKESFYELLDKDMNGKEVQMSSFKGNVLLVVNVASK